MTARLLLFRHRLQLQTLMINQAKFYNAYILLTILVQKTHHLYCQGVGVRRNCLRQ